VAVRKPAARGVIITAVFQLTGLIDITEEDRANADDEHDVSWRRPVQRLCDWRHGYVKRVLQGGGRGRLADPLGLLAGHHIVAVFEVGCHIVSVR
jgi:hypothetical protein